VSHSKRVGILTLVLALLIVGALAGALFANAALMSTLVLPTLAPTIMVPTLTPSLTVTLPPQPTLTPSSPPSPTPTWTATPTLRPTVTATATSIPIPTATMTELPPSPTPTVFPTRPPQAFVTPPRPFSGTVPISGPLPIPTAVSPVEAPPGTINIIVLGSDRRPDWEDWHTDVVQLVSIQPLVPAVTVLSIPRDLYVYIPGYWMSRINFVNMYGEVYGHPGGGFALLQETLLYNLGIQADHYVRTDFDGLIGIVDALGGVDIPVHCRLQDYWPYPDENGVYPIKVVEPGIHHMDGETALWYARSRKTTSTFDRERRQQQVLQAIWRRSRSLDLLPQLPQLWGQLQGMIVTDMDFGQVATLAGVAFRLDEQNVRFRNIGYAQVIPWTTPQGGSVFLPNWGEIEPVVAEALGPVPEGRMWRRLQTVEVWNGTFIVGWDQLAADRLFREGFGVTIGQADRQDYAQMMLVDYTASTKGSAASYLAWMFAVSPGNVVVSPDLNGGVPYRLIIGADYQPCRRP
jgi:LCP family protein required for cell wall assembly